MKHSQNRLMGQITGSTCNLMGKVPRFPAGFHVNQFSELLITQNSTVLRELLCVFAFFSEAIPLAIAALLKAS